MAIKKIMFHDQEIATNVSKTSELTNDSGFITSPNVVYCTCSTAAGTAAKVATISSGTLTTLNAGDQAIVKFTYANSVANPTLKIGNTDAKSIKRYGTTSPSTSAATSWNAGSPILFVYDGTYWVMCGFLNSTYSEISEANITNGSGSSTGLITGRRVKKAVETFAHNVPSGGTNGQVLAKNSNTDYDLTWVDAGGGGGAGVESVYAEVEFTESPIGNATCWILEVVDQTLLPDICPLAIDYGANGLFSSFVYDELTYSFTVPEWIGDMCSFQDGGHDYITIYYVYTV